MENRDEERNSLTKEADGLINNLLKVIGQNIRRKRGEMTQKKLEGKSGVSRSTIQKIEKGVSIELDNLLMIAKALDMTPADLYLTETDRQIFNYKIKMIVDKLADMLNIKGEGNEGNSST